jgi:hypothetical protein
LFDNKIKSLNNPIITASLQMSIGRLITWLITWLIARHTARLILWITDLLRLLGSRDGFNRININSLRNNKSNQLPPKVLDTIEADPSEYKSALLFLGTFNDIGKYFTKNSPTTRQTIYLMGYNLGFLLPLRF